MRVVVLTGAGISAESGLATFRDADGLWEGHRPEDVATPEAFAFDPELVQRFYDDRRAGLAGVAPNAAHEALARLEQAPDVELTLVTQNIDDLHERAGSRHVLHMHGRLRMARCTTCGETSSWTGTLLDRPLCPGCGHRTLRPDVVWFGEIPHHLEVIERAVLACDLFVSIGTSGVVYPAAGLVALAAARGARTLELNLEPSHGASDFDEARTGPATRLVPEWVAELVGDPA